VKNKLFFLLVLPLAWFAVALISEQSAADKLYVLAVAPSMWLFFWEEQLTVTIQMVQLVGLPVMFLVGLFLLLLKMKPCTMMISSGVMTCILWFALVVTFSQSHAIQVPGAIFIWILCCFNFSLCLLPLFAVSIKLVMLLKRKITKP
jgi:hypothetical protein